MRKEESSGVIAVDDGGHSTCVVTKNHQVMFPSVKGSLGDRSLMTVAGEFDFIVEYNNEKFIMGEIAVYDCDLPIQMHTKSKSNLFFDLSVLVSIFKYGYISNNLVVSTPIKTYNIEEVENRKQRLIGRHTITVNGKTKTFFIEDVRIAPETAIAYWVNQDEGLTRWIDLGSRTIGYATTINENGKYRFIDTQSGNFFSVGLEALDDQFNPKSLADYIGGRLSKKFNPDDKVKLLGGGALNEELVHYIKQYFPRAEVMDNPQMVNAKGMYILGRGAYGMA